jgi:hypothetical protein
MNNLKYVYAMKVMDREVFGDSMHLWNWFIPTKPHFGRFAELAEYE